MKAAPKVNKSPYNNPPVKLRAQIIPQKIPTKKPPQSQSSSDSSSQSSSYDSEVEDFANQFYDEEVKNADKSLQEKNQNQQKDQTKANQQQKVDTKQSSPALKKSKKPQTQWDKISSRLKQLKGTLPQLDMDLILFKKKDQNKLKQIAQFLSKKHKEKKDFMKKLKKIKNSQKERRKIEEQMIKKKQKEQHQKRLKQIRSISEMIKEKIQKKKEEQQDRLQDIEAFYEQFHKKYKNRKLYKLMELSDKKKRNKQFQKQQQYLKQRRNVVSQIISPEEIKQFNKRREEYLKDSQKVKLTEKQQKTQQIMQKNRQLREKIYIGNKYLEMQEESSRKQKIKQVPKQKLDRIKKYNQIVRENFMPSNKSDQAGEDDDANQREKEPEEEEIVEIDGKLYRKVKKDRYLKGQKIGEMILNVPIPKTEKEQRMVGNSYLEQLKLLPKKRHSTSLDLSRKSQPLPKPKSSTPRIQIPKIPKKLGKINLSKNANRHEIQNLINSLKAKDQLISRQEHYMKAVSKGVQKKEQLDENLIDNIEKKINLLSRL